LLNIIAIPNFANENSNCRTPENFRWVWSILILFSVTQKISTRLLKRSVSTSVVNFPGMRVMSRVPGGEIQVRLLH
jgi:hypothetical protein